MQTRKTFDVRTIVAIVSLGALVSVVLWSVGFGLASTQSLQSQVNDLVAQRDVLQTQVTSLQNQATSLNTQVTQKQTQIENLEAQLTQKQAEIDYFEALVALYDKYILMHFWETSGPAE